MAVPGIFGALMLGMFVFGFLGGWMHRSTFRMPGSRSRSGWVVPTTMLVAMAVCSALMRDWLGVPVCLAAAVGSAVGAYRYDRRMERIEDEQRAANGGKDPWAEAPASNCANDLMPPR